MNKKRYENWHLFAYGILILIFIIYYLPSLSFSLWHDEVVTVSKFASNGLKGVFMAPYEANNHILYSVILSIILKLFTFSEIAVRLPSVIFAALFLFSLFFFLKKYFGFYIAWGVGITLLLNNNFVDLAFQARGYTIVFLCTVMVSFTCYEWLEQNNVKSRNIFILFSVIGIWTYMLFCVYVGCLLIYIFFAAKKGKKKEVLISGIAVIICAALPYVPLAQSMYRYYAKNLGLFGDKLSWNTFLIHNLTNCINGLGIKSSALLGRGIATILWLLGIIFLMLKVRPLSKILFAGYFGFNTFIMLFQINAGSRYFYFLDFLTLLFVFYGISSLWKMNQYKVIWKIVVVISFMITASIIFAPQNIHIRTRKNIYPIEAFKESVKYISSLSSDAQIIICSQRSEGFKFYLDNDNLNNYIVLNETNNEIIYQKLVSINKESDIVVVDHILLRDGLNFEKQDPDFNQKQLSRGSILVYMFEKNEL